MKRLLCVLGCFILIGSNLVFADNNENRVALEFHKPEAANFNNFEDNYKKKEEGDEVFGEQGFNLRMFDKDGVIIYQAPYVFTENDEPIPDEYFIKAHDYYTTKKGKDTPVKKIKYNSVTYSQGQAFVKESMLYRDIDIIALDEITIVDNGSLQETSYLTSSSLAASAYSVGTFYSNTVKSNNDYNMMEITVQYSGNGYAPSGCSYSGQNLGTTSVNLGGSTGNSHNATQTYNVNISGKTTVSLTATLNANNPHSGCGVSSCNASFKIIKLRLYNN